jgi:cell division protein FtsA
MICALDVGTTKIVALIAEVDEADTSADRSGLRAGAWPASRVVIDTAEAQAVIAQAIAEAENSADQVMGQALRGHRGQPHQPVSSKAVVAVGSGRAITRDDTASVEQACRTSPYLYTDIIHAVRSYTVDDQKAIQNPIGMFDTG